MKHFLKPTDFSKAQAEYILGLAASVKKNPEYYQDALKGLTLGLLFEKPSTRTWASFHAGMTQLGGDTLYFGPSDIAMGKREEVKDISRVLSSYLGGFVLRTFAQKTISEYARFASKPVINGLSDLWHPCQVLADYFTMAEHFGIDELHKLKIVYVGDANNVFYSLMIQAAIFGLQFSYATPKAYAPDPKMLNAALKICSKSKGTLKGSDQPAQACRGAHVIYTDVWVSMGEENESLEKKKAFTGFQINQKLLKVCAKNAIVMHCLPAHRGEEITDQVIEGKQSICFLQAANRLPMQKAILLYLLSPNYRGDKSRG